MSRLLVVDDDIQLLSALETALRYKGHDVVAASNGVEALARFRGGRFEAVITDLKMPQMDGIDLLRELRALDANLPIVVVTAHGTVPEAVDALKQGAHDFLTKPFSHDALDRVLAGIGAGVRPRFAPSSQADLVTAHPAMRAVLDQAAQAAQTAATILVQAESGTGKELLARWIHRNSSRHKGPFVAVNCAALPESLLESELFGYEKGAFTGANQLKPGRFELAQNGTILLDEIGEMAPLLQAKLLRVLQEQEVDRVGGRRPIPIDVRVIATTNKDLRKLIAKGMFREDLYFRLNVVPLKLPPLRERKEDIPALARHFMKKHGNDSSEPDSTTLDLLSRYSWPGNVRELENVIQRSYALRGRCKILPADLFDGGVETGNGEGVAAGYTVSEMERRLIVATLDQTNGNRTHAARMLGISLRTLRNKLKEYRVEGATA